MDYTLLDLPHPVLCNIFSYLNESIDRQHAAITCRALYDAYAAPEVWYNVRFNVCSNFYLYEKDPQLPTAFRDTMLIEDGTTALRSNIARYNKLVSHFGAYFRSVELNLLVPSLTTLTFNEETSGFIDLLASKANRANDISINFRVLSKPSTMAYSAEIDSRLYANQRADMRCLLRLADFIAKCDTLKTFAFQNWPYTLSNVFAILATHSNATRFVRIETLSSVLFASHYEASASDRWIAPPPSVDQPVQDADSMLSQGVMYLFRELNRSPDRPVNMLMHNVNSCLVEFSVVVDLISDTFADKALLETRPGTKHGVLPNLRTLTLAITRHTKPLGGWLLQLLLDREARNGKVKADASSTADRFRMRLIFAARPIPEVRVSYLDRNLPLSSVAFSRYVTIKDEDLVALGSAHKDRLEQFVCLSDDTQFSSTDLLELCKNARSLAHIQYLAKLHVDVVVALANLKREAWRTFIFRDISYEPSTADAVRAQFRCESDSSPSPTLNYVCGYTDRYNYLCSAVSCALRRKWQPVKVKD